MTIFEAHVPRGRVPARVRIPYSALSLPTNAI